MSILGIDYVHNIKFMISYMQFSYIPAEVCVVAGLILNPRGPCPYLADHNILQHILLELLLEWI